MIFSADLDRTLIFSPRRLTGDVPVVPAEYRQGAPAGFITPGALSALGLLQKRAVFMVNTLRGLEQARRVVFVRDGACRYLALQNGLYLYRDGVEDREWSGRVRRTVADLPLDLGAGADWIQRALPGIECLSKQYEYLAVFFVDEERFDDAACGQLGSELSRKGWALFRQRKKLYLSPSAIDKGRVLDRVRTLEGDSDTVGFGDSWFDLPMLRACGTAWSLRGCELDGGDWGFPIRFSSAPGEAGTEEVLHLILGER